MIEQINIARLSGDVISFTFKAKQGKRAKYLLGPVGNVLVACAENYTNAALHSEVKELDLVRLIKAARYQLFTKGKMQISFNPKYFRLVK